MTPAIAAATDPRDRRVDAIGRGDTARRRDRSQSTAKGRIHEQDRNRPDGDRDAEPGDPPARNAPIIGRPAEGAQARERQPTSDEYRSAKSALHDRDAHAGQRAQQVVLGEPTIVETA